MATKEINARRARGMTIASIKLIVMLDEETDALMEAVCSRLKLSKSALARLAIMRASEELVPSVAAASKACAERRECESELLRRFAPEAADERAAAKFLGRGSGDGADERVRERMRAVDAGAGVKPAPTLPREQLMKVLVWAARGAQTPGDVAEVTEILGRLR